MSSLDVALRGGPPWGFRIGHDESERPIIAKVLPGGRAAAEGVHEGDVIQAVNNEPIREAKSAHTKVHSTTPGLTLFLKLVRYAPDSTPSLVHNSIIDTPLVTRKEFPKPAANATNENGAVRNNNYSPHLPRSLRLDVQSSERGLRTQDKRRFFENLCNSPKLMRDPLLARKIALGLADANSAPSESGTYVSGYDSVFGDLCDGSRLSSVASVRSDGPSSVNSVNGDEDNTQCETLLLPEPDIERALHQQHKPLGRQPDQPPPITQDPLSCLYLPPLSPLPSGTFGSALPSLSPAKMEPAGPSTPSSYLVHAPHSYPAPQVLDHAPPAVPPHQNGSNGWTVRTEVANVQPAHCEIEVPGRRSVAALREHIAEKLDVHGPDQKPRPKTPVKSWIKVHEPGTFEPPAAAASAASQGFGRVLDGPLPASANFYQGVPPPSYNYVHPKKVTPPKSSDDDSATPSSASELFTADSRLLKNNSNGYPQANGYPPLPQQQRIPQDSPAVEARARSCVTPCRMERPSIERVSIERATLQTSDLESAELGRRHSPSFSSASSEHLGTIRRKPKESEVDLPVKMDSGVSSTMDIHVPMLTPGDSPGYASYSTATHDSPADSGYDASPESRKDSLITVRESPPPPFSSHITEAFTSLPPSVLPSKDEKKDELPSKARVEEPVQEERPSSTTPGPNYKRDDSEMGAWYRNMYKRLHKIEGGDASILKYYLNDDSSVPGSRPHTPSTRRGASPPIAYRAPSPATSTQFDVDARPRARSVGREYHGPSAALPPPSPTKKHGERLSEDGAAARGTTPVGSRALPRPPSALVKPCCSTCSTSPKSSSHPHKTVHFHLPSYRFVDEDSRGIVTPSGRACLRCGLPRRKDDGLEKIYAAVSKAPREDEPRPAERSVSDRLDPAAAARIADKLESAAEELARFLASLGDATPVRSHSSPAIGLPSASRERRERLAREASHRAIEVRKARVRRYELAEEIERLKRITSDEMATSIRAEKLGEELDRERSRRHGYIPSAAPSLQNNTDRFNGLLNAYGGDERNMSPARSVSSGTGVKMAIALYRFSPQSERELALNKGDIIRLRREIDGNWMEGERNGRVGIFPASYVEVEEPSERKERLRAVYPFTARNANEMSLKLGDVVTFRRPIDEYWTEGLNHIGEIGIFPTCYVRPIEEVMDAPLPAVIPERPKTPKLPGSGVSFGGVSYNDGFSSFDRPVERLDRRSHESALPPSQSSYDNSQRSPQSLTRTSAPPASHYHNIPDTSRFDDLVRDPSINLPFPLPERVPSEGRELKSRAAIEADAVRLDETLNELLATLPGSPIPVTKTENKPNGFHHPPSTAQPAAPASQQPHLNGGPGYAPTSSTNDKVAAWQHRHSTSGYTGAASMIPKGAQAFRVLYPYAPVNDDELELKVDDIVFVVEKCDDGWFIGTLLRTGQFGTFPGNFVESH